MWHPPRDTLQRITAVASGGWAPNTRRNHMYAMRQLHAFARNAGIPTDCTFPVEETVLCAWLATMHGVNAGSTAENALAGVRAEHILAGLPFPDSERVVRIIKSIVCW
jgi:hypothetical protein